MNLKKRFGFLMFVIGLFSETQVRIIGSLGISELVIFICAPFVYLCNSALFKRDGCGTFINLILVALLGCIISSLYNDIILYNFFRGFATPYGWLACFIVLYPILRKNPQAFVWYLLGAAISLVLCTFIFQNSYELAESELRGGDADAIMSGAIYWTTRISNFVTWPIKGFYMNFPVLYSAMAPVLFGCYSLISTASGRSQALIAFTAAALISYARKDVNRMKSVRKHILFFFIGGVFLAFIFKTVYSYTASTGMLGETSRQKYENQTRGGRSMFELLREGRGDLFKGMFYCYHHPIMGYGPWALDKERLYLEYYEKYGVANDYIEIMNSLRRREGRYVLVGAHSAMFQFWLAYGILGLPVWLYLFYLFYDYFVRHIGSVPEFFGFFALALPSAMWAIFFSPFGNRLEWGLLIAMLLLNRVISKERETYGPIFQWRM